MQAFRKIPKSAGGFSSRNIWNERPTRPVEQTRQKSLPRSSPPGPLDETKRNKEKTMCWEVHLGSDVELPQVEWEEAAPAFNTQPLSDTEERVRIQFSVPHVICLGKAMGSGLEDLKVSSKIKSSSPDPIDFPEIHRYSLFRKELR
jgi:hypothetical protein